MKIRRSADDSLQSGLNCHPSSFPPSRAPACRRPRRGWKLTQCLNLSDTFGTSGQITATFTPPLHGKVEVFGDKQPGRSEGNIELYRKHLHGRSELRFVDVPAFNPGPEKNKPSSRFIDTSVLQNITLMTDQGSFYIFQKSNSWYWALSQHFNQCLF